MAEVALVNPNVTKPAIGPLGLEYLAEACRAAGIQVEVIDLCFEADPLSALREGLGRAHPALVGITLRNTDNCFLASSHSFIPELAEVVATVREVSPAPTVLGGAGFSVAPAAIMREVGADYGVLGDGEEVMPLLTRTLEGKGALHEAPGLLWREGNEVRGNAPSWPDLSARPGLRRDMVDNARYLARGGQLGLETKRGCDGRCIYCADPLSKGPRVRPRSPRAVADEVESLLAQGLDVYHLCDSEFNLPESHARGISRELIRRGLGERMRWYGYLSPRPFSSELADLMQRAGCAGINFGADSGNDEILARLGRDFSREDVLEATRLCRARDIAVMLDLLIGAPGETRETAAETIAMAKRADPSCIGISLGVRIYPGTRLARMIMAQGPLPDNPAIWGQAEDNEQFLQPVFYLSPELGTPQEASDFLAEIIGGDERFFFGGSGDESDYDYDENQPLVDAIAAGARGAYWDILRQLRSG